MDKNSFWSCVSCCVLTYIFVLVNEVASHKNCPDTTGTLYAYPEGDTLNFHDNFDPAFQTNIDLIDDLLYDEVACSWEIRAKNDHYANIVINDFQLLARVGTENADCLKIFDGDSPSSVLLGAVCGGDTPEESYTSSSDRHLYIVYTRGGRKGRRSFQLTYKALARPKDFIIKIAAIASGTVAAAAITFLAFKFTRCCRPCRRRCCPSTPEDPPQRELRPLNSGATNPAPTVNRVDESAVGGVVFRGGGDASNGHPRPIIPPPVRLTVSGEAALEPDDGEHTPPGDEAPPSYDSIFGDNNPGSSKANT